MRKLLVAVGLAVTLAGISAASAQASGEDRWCNVGDAELAVFSMNLETARLSRSSAPDWRNTVSKIYQACRPGDSISVPGTSVTTTLVNVMCDFGKTIARVGNEMVCILGPRRSPVQGN